MQKLHGGPSCMRDSEHARNVSATLWRADQGRRMQICVHLHQPSRLRSPAKRVAAGSQHGVQEELVAERADQLRRQRIAGGQSGLRSFGCHSQLLAAVVTGGQVVLSEMLLAVGRGRLRRATVPGKAAEAPRRAPEGRKTTWLPRGTQKEDEHWQQFRVATASALLRHHSSQGR